MCKEDELKIKALEVVSFLAANDNVSTIEFIEATLKKKNEKRAQMEKIAEIKRQLKQLSKTDREELLNELKDFESGISLSQGNVTDSSLCGKSLSLEELVRFGHADLARKPKSITVNGQSQLIRNWDEAPIFLVQQLLINGDLSSRDLPLIPTDRSTKAFVNHSDEQLNGRDSKFKKVGDGIYVDTKYNKMQHVKNMYNALKKLAILGKYDVSITQ